MYKNIHLLSLQQVSADCLTIKKSDNDFFLNLIFNQRQQRCVLWLVCVQMEYSIPAGSLPLVQPRPSPVSAPAEAMLTAG